MSDLQNYYECNGGAFFWVATHDVNGAWSSTVSAVTEPKAGCSLGPTAPVPAPVSPPTAMPVVSPPTAAPVASPNVKEDSRLVAYLGNWQACPSASHVAK